MQFPHGYHLAKGLKWRLGMGFFFENETVAPAIIS